MTQHININGLSDLDSSFKPFLFVKHVLGRYIQLQNSDRNTWGSKLNKTIPESKDGKGK